MLQQGLQFQLSCINVTVVFRFIVANLSQHALVSLICFTFRVSTIRVSCFHSVRVWQKLMWCLALDTSLIVAGFFFPVDCISKNITRVCCLTAWLLWILGTRKSNFNETSMLFLFSACLTYFHKGVRFFYGRQEIERKKVNVHFAVPTSNVRHHYG